MLEKNELAFLIKALENANIRGVDAYGVVHIFKKLQTMHDNFDLNQIEPEAKSVKKVISKK